MACAMSRGCRCPLQRQAAALHGGGRRARSGPLADGGFQINARSAPQPDRSAVAQRLRAERAAPRRRVLGRASFGGQFRRKRRRRAGVGGRSFLHDQTGTGTGQTAVHRPECRLDPGRGRRADVDDGSFHDQCCGEEWCRPINASTCKVNCSGRWIFNDCIS